MPTTSPGLFCWIYASQSLLPAAWAGSAIDNIVAASRQKNAELDVTGALLFTGSKFVQIIEGPLSAVSVLRESIARDPRHHQISTLVSNEAVVRLFDGWSLAYAGPSLFVSNNVAAALGRDPRAVNDLILLLREFAASAR